ncbi:MAG TPA: hypothetical protein DCL65_10100 [Chryseobacterium sp.]|nr:hypothetical protein [Chryseobacterium sp.]
MKQIKQIVCFLFFYAIVISCNSDYKYAYKSTKDPENSFIIETLDNRTKMIISMSYQNHIENDLYYLRVNNEFYQCEKTFSIDSIGKDVQFSSLRDYKIPSKKFNIDRLIIKKAGSDYVSIFNMTDYSGTVSLKFFYDKNYKIFKIEDNEISYMVTR